MKYSVQVAQTARNDLHDIFDYLVAKESREQAQLIFDKVTASLHALQTLPDRGNYPPELEHLGIRRYREIHCAPYRIVYEVMKDDVVVHCVLDARRDIHAQLLQRVVRS